MHSVNRKSHHRLNSTAPHPLLTLRELGRWFRVHPSSVYHLVGAKDIPVLRIGGSWRFNQDAIEKWMLDKISDNARVDDGSFYR
jgi:excisionase family DNA binding protein